MSDEKKVTKKESAALYIPKRGIELPKPGQVKTAREVAGKNPPLYNLKDHNEFDGQKLMIFAATQAVGDYGTYVLLLALLYPANVDPYTMTPEQLEDYKCTISTGSENIIERALTAVASDSLPMLGTLRRGGRAWFLD